MNTSRVRARCFTVVLLLASPGFTHAACHVKADASGANNGSNWANAYVNLQSALTDTACTEVWVAKGVYKPTTSTTDRTASFRIRPGLQVIGGFAGTETSASQADPGVNRTVLSGDIDGNDTTDANGVVLNANQITGNNTAIVVRIDGTTAAGSVGMDTVLDGFAITAGTGSNQEGLNASVAGGLYCNANANGRTCSPTLRRLWLAGNRADFAGAMLVRGENGGVGKPVIHDSTFSGNRANGDAGAIYNYGYGGEASPRLINVTFSANQAGQYGGALFNESTGPAGSTRPVLIGVTLAGNSANAGGGAILNDPADGIGGSLSLNLDAVIVWGNGTQIQQLGGNGLSTIRDSVIAGGCPATFATCSNVSSTSPALGALQYNGGATPTMLPSAGGSAIDAANPVTCGAASHDADQRGTARPQGSGCDIGAVELRQTQLAVAVAGPGAVSGSTTQGAPAASGGIVDCSEEAGTCVTGYAAEPAAPRVVLSIVPDAHAQLEDITDICGVGGDSIGVLEGNTYTIDPLGTDCLVLVTFALDQHAITGSVSGLLGDGLRLQNAGDETLEVSADGTFSFSPAPFGTAYDVEVIAQPSQPWQTCVVTNGSGNVGDDDVDDITVTCTTDVHSVGGSVAGLAGSGLALTLNGSETLPVSANGTFTFTTLIESGSTYQVMVASQPDLQDCTMGNGNGTIESSDIESVTIDCAAAPPALALSVGAGSGYARYGQVIDYVITLRNDGRGPATAVPVSSTFSSAFDAAFAQWQCFGSGAGASCAASGNGPLTDTVTLPPGRSMSWLLSVPVHATTSEPTAMSTFAANGITPSEVTDTRVLVLLRDGFDVPYGERAVAGSEAMAILEGTANHRFVLEAPFTDGVTDLVTVAGLTETLIVQFAPIETGLPFVRLLHRDAQGSERVTSWTAAEEGARLVLGTVHSAEDRRVFLLDGAQQPALLAVPANE